MRKLETFTRTIMVERRCVVWQQNPTSFKVEVMDDRVRKSELDLITDNRDQAFEYARELMGLSGVSAYGTN